MKIKRIKSPKKDNFLKNIGLGLLLLLLVISIVGLYSQPLVQKEEAGLSRLAQEINGDNVASVEVNQEEITVALKNSDINLVTRKEAGTSITETL